MDELTAWLTLARAPGLHSGTLVPLLQKFSSVTALVAAPPETLRAAGADARLAAWLRSPPRQPLAQDQRWLEGDGRHFIAWGAKDYPQQLAQIGDAPIGLFVRGNPALLSLPQLALVGSRNPTPPGRETAQHFASQLSHCGLAITSGLAVGIDTASHQGALEAAGTTIAVCGTGLDIGYPAANRPLADQIASKGALISEFPPGTPAWKENFPRRNRIISGLALGTLVVEAALRSGSLITARLAAEQGREVFAVPGSIRNPLARGCHQLIRQGARLVETAQEVLEELCPPTGRPWSVAADAVKNPEISVASSARLDKEYEILLDALGFEPAGVDLLVVRTGLRADEVASMLLILELAGHVDSYPGGLYVRARPKAVK
ncbi:MAG TPA: DNA-processing protein DprA [Povalibacter sp.]|nr:DNA-processing protein DprA [Povalibacter sp.]